MITISLSLAQDKVVRLSDLRHLHTIVVTTKKTRQEWTLTVHDVDFHRYGRQPHDWVDCYRSDGRKVRLHVSEEFTIDRMSVHRVRHRNATAQIALPFAAK